MTHQPRLLGVSLLASGCLISLSFLAPLPAWGSPLDDVAANPTPGPPDVVAIDFGDPEVPRDSPTSEAEVLPLAASGAAPTDCSASSPGATSDSATRTARPTEPAAFHIALDVARVRDEVSPPPSPVAPREPLDPPQPTASTEATGLVVASSPSPPIGDEPPPTSAAATTTSTFAPTSTETPTAIPTAGLTPILTETTTGTPASSLTPTPTGPTTGTPASSLTPTPTGSTTDTPTSTLSTSPSPSALPVALARQFAVGTIRINEIAWAGTLASSSDEWIELFNPGLETIDLEGWRLTDGGDIDRSLAGRLSPGEYFLLERTDDATVSDLPADLTYRGSLRNEGETLELLDPDGAMVDRANADGGDWPAGDRSTRASMQRLGEEDVWETYPGCGGNGLDAGGAPIQGTPRQANALGCVLPTSTATPTPTPAVLPTQAPEGAVLINEVAWAGTHASSSDEWIELFNPGHEPIDLHGWHLTDGGDIDASLAGELPAGGYFLLERSDDHPVADIPADAIYGGTLSNDGERLELVDSTGAVVDVANRRGGDWPAGEAGAHASMERTLSGGWGTYSGYGGNGRDAGGNPIAGTPRQANSLLFPTPRPTWIPGEVVINEVLIRPHYDWERKGGIDTDDEFIELYNSGPRDVQLGGWILDDLRGGGSTPFVLPSRLIEADGFAVFFRSRTSLALNDTGDTVTLRAPNGHTVDTISYLRVEAYNLSYGRLPDGSNHFAYGLWPTPRDSNRLYTPPTFPVGTLLISEVAWAGTQASANDEWIELWNPGEAPVALNAWVLTDDNDVCEPLTGTLAPGGFLLLERTNDGTITDLAADAIYTGVLSDDGERLRLLDPSGREIDGVDASRGWPEGDKQGRLTMERFGGKWFTFHGWFGRGRDSGGQPILGTPGADNSRALEAALSCPPGAARATGLCP